MPKTRCLLILLILLAVSCSGSPGKNKDQTEIPAFAVNPLLDPVPVPGERRRGFNLTGMFSKESSPGRFPEQELAIIAEFGFNYARIPLDYRFYTKYGDWFSFDEKGLRQIDKLIEWALKYGIHIELNLHRAPGYCVNAGDYPDWLKMPESQKLDLWSDPEAREAFYAHWEMFARRYRAVSSEYLGFNLLNEPAHTDLGNYLSIMKEAIRRIRAVSPDRSISIDGYRYATELDQNLIDLGVILCKHSYDPGNITHFKAEWMPGSDKLPVPAWPPQGYLPDHIYGPFKEKDKLYVPLLIEGNFPAGTEITVTVVQVSNNSTLTVSADEDPVLEHRFIQSNGKGEWEKVIFVKRWNIYQNIYNKKYSAKTGKASSRIKISVSDGDWLSFSEISITAGRNTARILPTISNWGIPPGQYRLDGGGKLELIKAPPGFEDNYRINDHLDDWREAAARQNADIFIGEFGVYNKTPHTVTMALLEYKLAAFKKAGFGWALWNLNGPFGPLNSGRNDVDYENYKGFLLDRKMMDLLQKY